MKPLLDGEVQVAPDINPGCIMFPRETAAGLILALANGEATTTDYRVLGRAFRRSANNGPLTGDDLPARLWDTAPLPPEEASAILRDIANSTAIGAWPGGITADQARSAIRAVLPQDALPSFLEGWSWRD